MPKHGTASQVSGSYVEFQAAVLRALPRDINADVAFGWTQNGEVLARALREALLPQSDNLKPGNTFMITCTGAKTSELVRIGRYSQVHGEITDEKFPIAPHPVISRRIELIEFDNRHGSTNEEVFAEFAGRGLERPTYEDALSFGVAHSEEQMKRPIVFLHSPVKGDYTNFDGGVLVLASDLRGRVLGFTWFVRWPRRYVFAGIRKA